MADNQLVIKHIGSASDSILVKDQEGTIKQAHVSEVIEDNVKLIFAYFSMEHCGPCREFTPILAGLYEEQTELYQGKKLYEVVFFSCDSAEKDFAKYFQEMPWIAMPFNDPRNAQLSRMLGVKAVPHLCAFRRSDGKILQSQAVSDVLMNGPDYIDELLSQC